MEKKLTKRQQQALEAKEKIRASAMTLFAEQGFNQVTIEMICQNAGVSTGLLYNYFPSKEAILVEDFRNIDNLYREMHNKFTPQQTARERINTIYAQMLNHIYSREIDLLSAKVAYTNAIKAGNSPLNDQNRFFFQMLREDVIHYGKERGEIKAELTDEEILGLFHVFTLGTILSSFIEEEPEAYIQRTLPLIDMGLNCIFN